MIRLEDVVLSAGGQDLLLDATFHLRPGDRVGLVGRNGTGKTTLLRAIIGEHELDRGKIHKRKDARLGYLPQQATAGSERSVWDETRSGMVRLTKLEGKLKRAQTGVEKGVAGAIQKLADAEQAFQLAGGYAWDEKVGTVLNGLGFDTDLWSTPCSELSGGWQMRTALARMLLSEPDVALLDEPTNHLDLHARTWLAEALRTAPWTTVIVSHDRHLLDRVATHIVELRGQDLHVWKGNFSRFLVAREEARELKESLKAKQDDTIAHLQGFVDRFGAKATKAAAARSRVKQLNKIERIELDAEPVLPRMRIPEPPASAQRMVRLVGADVGWPDSEPLIQGLDLEVERGMRIALVGDNGCGKSTLLKTLAGELATKKGRRVPGDRVRMGVFHQDLAQALPMDDRGMDVVAAVAPLLETHKVRGILGALGLSGEVALRKIRALSGGEKARVALASLTCVPHNLLLLDEPTNHLDAETVEVLVRALKAWTGALVLVSHDRYVVEQLATHILRLDGEPELKEGVRDSDFERTTERKITEVDTTKRESHADRKKLQREGERAKKRLEKLPGILEKAEAKIAALDTKLVEASGDWNLASELGAERDTVQAKVDALYTEWEKLEAALEELGTIL